MHSTKLIFWFTYASVKPPSEQMLGTHGLLSHELIVHIFNVRVLLDDSKMHCPTQYDKLCWDYAYILNIMLVRSEFACSLISFMIMLPV